ncbi:MAG: hypothetical protein WCP66_08270, partial [Methylococcales bacterium]
KNHRALLGELALVLKNQRTLLSELVVVLKNPSTLLFQLGLSMIGLRHKIHLLRGFKLGSAY